MESFINALARAQDPTQSQVQSLHSADIPPLRMSERVLTLSPARLKANRVVGFDGSESITRSFDVLRNTCTKNLTPRLAHNPIIGVTSPGAGSGVSTTAINLAFSLARLQKGNVLLADLATCDQGYRRQIGLTSEDAETCFTRYSVVRLDVNGIAAHAASLLPVVAGRSGIEIKAVLRDWVAAVRRELSPVTIVLDLPPLLTDDRATSFISEIDLVLLVLATGKSTMAELETSKSYLHDAANVQLVLNKAREYDL